MRKTKTLSSQHPHPLAVWLLPLRQFIHDLLKTLPAPIAEFILFGLKMAWSCLFGAIFLMLLIVTHLYWPNPSSINRYDFLLVCALVVQIIMILTKLETLEEAKVIAIYHVVGTLMEIFKTHMGSWQYPEPAFFAIGGVPLFTGFMYATVGSFIARAIKVCEMVFAPYPPLLVTYILAFGIYVNFFTHHYMIDLRLGLFVIIIGLYFKTNIYFRIMHKVRSMPFLIAWSLTTLFLWIAENIGTMTRTWAYPDTRIGWHPVPLTKMGAWALLLIISFVIVFAATSKQHTTKQDQP